MATPSSGHHNRMYSYFAQRELILRVNHVEAIDVPDTYSLIPLMLAALGNSEGNLEFVTEAFTNLEDFANIGVGTFESFSLFLLRWTKEGLSVTDFYNQLAELIEETGLDLGNGASLQAPLFNWYMGAAAHTSIGVHGPGKRPRPVDNSLLSRRFKFGTISSAQITAIPPIEAHKTPSWEGMFAGGLDVYILDTIPSHERIHNAWQNWGNSHLSRFQAILDGGANGIDYQTAQADYFYSSDLATALIVSDELSTQGNPLPLVMGDSYESGNHEIDDEITVEQVFDTSDHGLFIAGIVHEIAPQAKIKVIQVLNDYGVGSLWHIAQGFKRVRKMQLEEANQGRRSIINCSINFAFPVDGHKGQKDQNPNHEWEDLDVDKYKDSELDRFCKEQTAELLKAIRDLVTEHSIIVAAAGNDSERDKDKEEDNKAKGKKEPKESRYPARMEEVVGVGALKKNGNAADYSNKSDNPQAEGIFVFGGDYKDEKPPFNDVGEGMIGIYTGDFKFDHTKRDVVLNTNGFAEWAGTSFASPVIAATIARVAINTGCSVKQAYDALQALAVAGPDAPKKFLKVSQD